MNDDWRSLLPYDPVPLLLDSASEAVRFFVERDLLEMQEEDKHRLWEMPAAKKLMAKQCPDGSWKYPGKPAMFEHAYHTLQTYRTLGDMVEKHAFDRQHPSVPRAVDFIFSSQQKKAIFAASMVPSTAPTTPQGWLR